MLPLSGHDDVALFLINVANDAESPQKIKKI